MCHQQLSLRLNGVDATCHFPLAPLPVVCPIKLLLLPQRCRFDLRLLGVFLYLFFYISSTSIYMFSFFFSCCNFNSENIYVARGGVEELHQLTFGYLHAFALLRLI